MNKPPIVFPPGVRSRLLRQAWLLLCAVMMGGLPWVARAGVDAYDLRIAQDAGNGLVPSARLTNAATFTGANRLAFNFGNVSGDVTMEFILEGNPSAIAGTAFLAVGANSGSNLRYEQWNNSGQLGFTQLGVVDYLFSPGAPSPLQPTHIAYVWSAASTTMKLYVNGSVAGTRAGVTAAFAMPTGQGWLGGNPSGTELLTGTIHRLTAYDEIIPDSDIQRHADAFNDIRRPPILISFAATPNILFTPNSTTLAWNIQNAGAIFLNGANVTGSSNRLVAPTTNTTYTLVATNEGGAVTGQVSVVVNPAPIINAFTASKGYAAPGETLTLSWDVSFGDDFSIGPDLGDVTPQTANGLGSVNVQISAPVLFTLAVGNVFGTSTATQRIALVHPAGHVVISEFMANNESMLADEDGAYSDWIELFNPTPTTVNLAGYYLSDDNSDPLLWPFPSLNLAPGGHLIVFASGQDRRNPATPLHTNFQLDQDGEYLALVGPGPTVLQSWNPFPAQQGDVSYGILGGDVTAPQFMGIPTPGVLNNIAAAPPVAVRFSRASGTFLQPFSLTLTSATPGAIIYYTVDGSVPGPANGNVYTGSFPISATSRVRAAAQAAGLTSRLSGASFIKLSPELTNYSSTLPIMVIENFGGGIIPQKGWSGDGSGLKQVHRQAATWATFEVKAGASALTNPPQMLTTIGIRGRGAFSSEWRQKPYSVEAIDEDGQEENVSPLGMPGHPDWVLYFPDPDNNKDPTLLFNSFPYELYQNFGHYGVRFRWVEAFVNEDGGDLSLADRRGVYAIVEKVSRGKDRLDFQRLSPDGSEGSWLLSLNRMDPEPETGWPAPNGATQPWFFHTAGPNRIAESPPNALRVGDDEPQQANGFLNFDNPSGYTINDQQRTAIENWFRQFEDVLWSNALWRDPTNGYRRYLDPIDFADYFIMNTLTRNGDGLLISMFPWKGDDGKLRMGPAWDYNWSPYFVSGGPTGSLLHRSEQLWYERLFTDPDFMQLYIDRWWLHRRGPMSNARMDAIIDGQAALISPAKALLNGLPSPVEWASRLTQMKTWLKDRANWIDAAYIRPPTFSQEGGVVADGFQLFISGTNGTIYFTSDGTDPRAWGGSIAPTAQAFEIPLGITAQTLVQARIRNGTNWSGLSSAVFYPPQNLGGLALTEIMFNPPPFNGWSSDDLEFIELKNAGTATLNLATFFFSAGIDYIFPDSVRLAPGEFYVLARNQAAFQARYPGVPVQGIYSGRLDNAGETLRLSTQLGSTVLSLAYDDRAPWPVAPDGQGFSLVPRTGTSVNSEVGTAWRASSAVGGSPGADDPNPVIPRLLINEVLANSGNPGGDWIELFNPTASAVDLGGWFLSNDGANPKKYRIPAGTLIPGGGYRILSEADFYAPPLSAFSFTLNSAGDSAYLSSGDGQTNLTGYSHGLTFGAAPEGVTFGRYVNSVGEEQFPALTSATAGSSNSVPALGPVVISEIMYHPEQGGMEFVEIKNISSSAVPLFAPQGSNRTWRVSGLGFVFPTNVVLPAQGALIISSAEPAAFRAAYQVPSQVQILGPFSGGLQDSGERLELQRPLASEGEEIIYFSVDAVRYNDKAPWPPAADGGGASLQRRVLSSYADDPVNWEAARPTPGAEFFPGQLPHISLQPASVSALATREAMFNIAVGGPGPIYVQWLFNDALLQGATNLTLLLSNLQPAQAGGYSAVLFNQAGSVRSDSAHLAIRAPALVTLQPRDIPVRIRPDPSSMPQTNVTFNVAAVSSSPVQYQWRFNGVPIPGATATSYTVTNVQLSDEGLYSAAVTDSAGTIFSQGGYLLPLISPYFIQPLLGQSVPVGGPVTLSVGVGGNPLPFTYEWRRGTATIQTNANAGRNNLFTFTATNVAQITQYRVIVKNQANSAPGVASGFVNIVTIADADGDGLPDSWELAHALLPNNPTDRNLDADGDGQDNWSEYIAGTDPNDPQSFLRVDGLTTDTGANISFRAISNKTYTLQFRETLPGSWLKLADIPARATNWTEVVRDPAFTPARFYRLLIP